MIQFWKILALVLIIVSAISCSSKNDEIFYDRPLNENWQFRKVGDLAWLPAKTPGCVISDLLRNKKIPDPFYRMNEQLVQWIENEDWEYQTTFHVNPDVLDQDGIELCFDGLDTYADVYLNDSPLIKTDNMFRSYEINCKSKIRENNNVLRICFHSPVKKGMEKLNKLRFTLPAEYEQASIGKHTSVFTRKASFQFGSDYGPRLVTSGIWRAVHLRAWSSAKICNLHFQPIKVSPKSAIYSVNCSIESKTNQNLNYDILINNKPANAAGVLSLKKGLNHQNISFTIDRPRLWWSNGLGVPYLYRITVRLKQENQVIHKIQTRIGIRTLELVHKKESKGSNFYFKLNNVPVFMKGANYVPSNALTTQVAPETYQRVIEDAKDANMNMLRVQGDGIYANDMFYDLCDENGILVWQDFMFSGSMQPGDSAHLENIRLEAIENIKRLRNHPCLALWCGNNETMINWNNLEWKNNYPKDTATKIQSNYEKIFYHILPEAVNSYDPETDYLASSPSPENNALPDVKSGDVHDWEIWTGNAPVQEYGKTSVPFASEYGLQSFPSMKTINSFSQKSDQQVHSKLMDFKQRNLLPKGNPKMNGNEKILEFIKNQYREPETFESLVYLSQVTQAEALKTAIENHRKSMPFCMGSLYRQLNDCWPTMSWSTVDFYGRWKLSHYSVRDAFSPILVVPVKENKHINIQAISDLTKDLEAILFVKLIDFNGKSLYVKQIPVKIKSNSSSQVLSLDEEVVLAKADKRNCCLIVQLNQPNKTLSQNILYFTEPKNLMLAKPHIDIVVNEAVKGYNLILKSEVLAKNIFLETSKKECSFADNNFDLLPGKRTKINVRYVGTKDEFMHDLKIISLADVY